MALRQVDEVIPDIPARPPWLLNAMSIDLLVAMGSLIVLMLK